jgi:hypothetical protein
VTGRGEAAPLEPYDGVPSAAVAQALVAYAEVVREFGPSDPGHLVLDACRAALELPEALAGRGPGAVGPGGAPGGAARVRAARGRVARPRPAERDDRGAGPRGRRLRRGAAVAAGFGCVKLKVGVGDDAGRVAAVRAALGPAPALRLDANGAWTVEEAVRTIEVLAPAGLELVEEPVTAWRTRGRCGRACPCGSRSTRPRPTRAP